MYPVRSTPREEWPTFVDTMQQVAAKRGMPFVPDMNKAPEDGFFSMPTSRDDTVRSTSAGAYLNATVRARKNLTLLTDPRVTRLALNGKQVVGVHAERNGESVFLSAKRVILSAGAIHSPTILKRSGIGKADDLSKLGIPVVADLPGVGQTIQTHC